MQVLQIKFDGFDQLVRIALRDDPNVQFFVHNLKSLQRPADEVTLFGNQTWENCIPPFLSAARQAKDQFGFDWNLDQLTRHNFNLWHRDIETFDITKHTQDQNAKELFFVRLHYLLHRAEGFVFVPQRHSTMLQVKWYHPSVAWPSEPVYDCYEWHPGDVTVDYPYVGKSPLISMRSKDNSNLNQSCRVPDACAPGFLIQLTDGGQPKHVVQTGLGQWYDSHADQLADSFTKDKMLRYAGEFCIGTMIDLDQIPKLAAAELSGAQLIT